MMISQQDSQPTASIRMRYSTEAAPELLKKKAERTQSVVRKLSEDSVIGYILSNPIDTIIIAKKLLKDTCFQNQRWAEIFRWAVAIYDASTREAEIDEKVNAYEAALHLSSKTGLTLDEAFDEIQGACNVAGAEGYSPSCSGVAYTLRKLSLEEQVYKQGEELIRGSELAPDHIESIAQGMRDAADSLLTQDEETTSPLMSVIQDTMSDIEERARNVANGALNGIPTGLKALDSLLLGGWQNTHLIVLAGRPAQGKSALALHFARKAAEVGKHVFYITLEMSPSECGKRLIQQYSSVDPQRIATGNLTGDDWNDIEVASNSISKLPIVFDNRTFITMSDIRAKARQLYASGQCDMIICDYLQIIEAPDSAKNRNNREREVAQISRQAKALAKELNIPVMFLAQLNRESEQTMKGSATKAADGPSLADLRESGHIEQDADVVIMIDRPETYGKAEMDAFVNGSNILIQTKGVVRLSIRKHRGGRTGEVIFSQRYGLSHISDYDEAFRPSAPVLYNPDAHIEPATSEDLPF